MMDGEEKRENKISFVERINREAGRPTEDPKKHSKKEVWVLEDVTGNEYVSDRSSSAGERDSNASWMKRGKNLFEEMFYEGRSAFVFLSELVRSIKDNVSWTARLWLKRKLGIKMLSLRIELDPIMNRSWAMTYLAIFKVSHGLDIVGLT